MRSRAGRTSRSPGLALPCGWPRATARPRRRRDPPRLWGETAEPVEASSALAAPAASRSCSPHGRRARGRCCAACDAAGGDRSERLPERGMLGATVAYAQGAFELARGRRPGRPWSRYGPRRQAWRRARGAVTRPHAALRAARRARVPRAPGRRGHRPAMELEAARERLRRASAPRLTSPASRR